MKAMHRLGGVGQTVSAFTLGATAGSMMALLFAPKSGEATRRQIGRQVRAWQRATVRELRQRGRMVAGRAAQWRQTAAEQLGQARVWLTPRPASHNGKRALHHRAAA